MGGKTTEQELLDVFKKYISLVTVISIQLRNSKLIIFLHHLVATVLLWRAL
jgi:hypothetical protein